MKRMTRAGKEKREEGTPARNKFNAKCNKKKEKEEKRGREAAATLAKREEWVKVRESE